MLEIKQLVKKYHTGDLAINGVDLKVEKGQVMALTIRCRKKHIDPLC